MIVMIGVDSEGLSFKMFPVLDCVPSTENINEVAEVDGAQAEGPASESVGEEVAMTSISTATSGAGTTLGKLAS